MKCPHCNRAIKGATSAQIEAYDTVYLKGFKMEEAAKLLGIDKANVSRRIKRLLAKYPNLWNPLRKI